MLGHPMARRLRSGTRDVRDMVFDWLFNARAAKKVTASDAKPAT